MSTSIAKQPLEYILRFDTSNSVSNDICLPKPKVSRTRTGCFNCRKRKKKCDESKPRCSTCESKCIPCVWPKQGERLPKEYKIPKADKELIRAKKLERRQYQAQIIEPPIVQSNKAEESIVPVIPIVPIGFHYDDMKSWNVENISLDNMVTLDNFDQDLIELLPGELTNDNEQLLNDGSNELQLYTTSKDSTRDYFECLDSEMVLKSKSRSPSPEYFFPFDIKKIDLESITINPTYEKLNDVLIVACANGFIKSINTQHTHPLLTTSATFTPLIRKNKLIEQVALSCGAAFLSWNNHEMKDLAINKYTESFAQLNDYLDSDKFDLEKDESWLGAAFQLMCLCSKVSWNCNIDNCVQNLNNSYRLIKLKIRYYDELYNAKKKSKQIVNVNDNEFLNELSNDDLKMEIENNLIKSVNEEHIESLDGPNNPYKGFFHNKFEKMFLDSFIYNYSIGILFVSDVHKLPNPFIVFQELRTLLKTPLFSCDVAWMNNPVFGASLNAYELAAKASFLLKSDLNDPKIITSATVLFDMAKYLAQPIIPIEARVNFSIYQNLRDSVLVSECVTSATKILLTKVLNPSISENDPYIQKEVNIIINKVNKVGETSQCKTVSSWALFICGLACNNSDHKKQLIKHLEIIGEITHAHYIYSVLEALEIAWGTNPNKDLFPEVQGAGLSGLFNSEFLSTICL